MIYSILFSTLVPSPFVTPLRMGWWKPTWRSWHSMPCQLPRSSTVSEPTCLRDCQGMWPDTDTGEHHQSIVIQYSLFFKKTVELPPLWQILNNFFCAAHWVNWLEFRTNTINMLICHSYLKQNQHDMCGMINGDLSVNSVLTWCATEVVFFHDSWLRLWLISPMHTACTDYIYTWQSLAKICPVCESPEFVWESFITFRFLWVGRHVDCMHLFYYYVYIISQHIVSSRNFCVSFPFTSAMCA